MYCTNTPARGIAITAPAQEPRTRKDGGKFSNSQASPSNPFRMHVVEQRMNQTAQKSESSRAGQADSQCALVQGFQEEKVTRMPLNFIQVLWKDSTEISQAQQFEVNDKLE